MIAAVFYLVLQYSSSIAVVPEPFTAVENCEKAGKAWQTKKPGFRGFECLKIESRLE